VILNEYLAIGSMTAECEQQQTLDFAVVYGSKCGRSFTAQTTTHQ